MKASTRNHFEGTVTDLQQGAVNDEVEITTDGGLKIVAVVTRTSSQSLGLAKGKKAVALVKAPSVVVVADAGNARFSARNALAGTVASVHSGAVNNEVVVDVAGGGQVVAIVTQGSAERLQLAAGQAVTVLFKAPSVIVAVTD